MSEEGGGISAADLALQRIETLKLQEERLKKEKEIAAVAQDHLGVMQKQLEIERFRNSKLIESLESLKKSKDINEELLAKGQTIAEFTGELAKNFKLSVEDANKLQAGLAKGNEEAKNALDELIQKQLEYRAQQDISKKFSEDIERSTSKLAQKMGIAAKFSGTTAGSMVEMAKSFVAGDTNKNMEALLGGFKNLFNPLNIAASLLDIMINKVFELNKAAIELNVATGYANDFQTEMTNLTAQTIQFGVSMKDSNAALGSVVKNVTGINLRSKEFRNELSNSAALMTKLGVSADTTAKNQQFLDKTFGMSGPKITATLEDIAMSAEAIGISAQEMSANFVEAMGYLSSFGEEGVRMFKEIQQEASRTGIAVNSLMKMTQTFDEFSAGASKAAELNAVLGTSLSSIALMSMTPEQRLKELTNQLRNATGGVDSMTHAQKLYLANSLNMSIAEMTALMGEETEEMRKSREAKEKQAEIEQRLADAATQLIPLMDRMSLAFEKLASNERLLNILGGTIEFIINLIVLIIDYAPGIVTALAAIELGIWGWVYATQGLTAAMATNPLGALGIVLVALATWFEDEIVTTGLYTIGAGLIFSALSADLAGGKYKILIGILAGLATLLGMTINPPFIQFGFFIAAGILAMGIAAKVGGTQLILLVAAFALLAGGVALVFYGMSALIESIKSLFTLLIDSLPKLPMLASMMYLLGSAFLFLGSSAMLGSFGLFMGIGALTIMLALFKLTGTSMKDLFGAGDEILKIGTGILNLGNGLTALKSAISEIKSTIGSEGLFAASIEGNSSSIVMGEGVHVAKLFKNNKVTVDVKMPKIAMPKIDVKVVIGDTELKNIVEKIVENRTGQVS